MRYTQARYQEVLEHGRVLDSGEFAQTETAVPYPIGDYWEMVDGVKLRINRDKKPIQYSTAMLLTCDAAKEKIRAIREQKVRKFTHICIYMKHNTLTHRKKMRPSGWRVKQRGMQKKQKISWRVNVF